MAADIFGNPTPYPPSIADTFADIQRYACVPLDVRLAYLDLRSDAMVGRATAEDAWARLRWIHLHYPVGSAR
jgi:hypothetical protein